MAGARRSLDPSADIGSNAYRTSTASVPTDPVSRTRVNFHIMNIECSLVRETPVRDLNRSHSITEVHL